MTIAAGPCGVTRASSVAGALREISVRQCVFGDVCKVQSDGVPGWHECAHGRARAAVKCLRGVVCLSCLVRDALPGCPG
jgi:hypothetical protein